VLYYWLLFFFFAVGALVSPLSAVAAGPGAPGAPTKKTPFRVLFVFGALGMIVLIGLRYKVGGDWNPYAQMLQGMRGMSLSSAMKAIDPGYGAVNWAATQTHTGIWFVNLVCAAIFAWGLFRLCSVQPSPWLAVAVAIPYMVIVVAMGYTRQAVALGFLMAGLSRQIRGANVVNFAFYVFAACLFHKTAVIAFPLVAISAKGNRFVNFLIVICASLSLYQFFLVDSMDELVRSYIDTEYSSQGAFIRVAMSAVAAAFFWLFRGRLGFTPIEYRIWRNFSAAAFVSLALLPIVPSSTAVDRISLYLLPLQVAVLTRVAMIGESRLAGTSMVLGYAFIIELVWLNYAQFARLWIPYQFYPFS
jgi:hypothetical protein